MVYAYEKIWHTFDHMRKKYGTQVKPKKSVTTRSIVTDSWDQAFVSLRGLLQGQAPSQNPEFELEPFIEWGGMIPNSCFPS